jgi:sugar lactone lactonase YvrE
VFAAQRNLLTSWGELGRADGQFVKPIGLALDSAGNVYVLDPSRGDIQKFDRDGAYLATFGGSGEGQIRDAAYLAIDGEDTLWVADNTRIIAFSTDGTFLRELGEGGDGPGQFGEAIDVTIDAVGILYVADLPHGWIQAFTADGTLLAVWDAGRTPGGVGNHPYALAPDNQGNLYVAGVGPDNHPDTSVQKFQLPALD